MTKYKEGKICKKAFTITELIVVIVIIGILAAILIPSITGYIKKANLSSDRTTCKNMNVELSAYLTENYDLDTSLLDAPDIRSILTSLNSKYTFTTKSVDDGYYFWYDKEKARIVLSQASDLTTNDLQEVDQKQIKLSPPIEEIIDGYQILNTGGDDLTSILYRLRSVSSNSDYQVIHNEFNAGSKLLESLKGFSKSQIDNLATHIEKFNPNQTLYINDFGSFTSSSGKITNIVYADGILSIPTNASLNIVELDSTLKIPQSVKYIEPGAFVSISTLPNGIVIMNENIRIARDAVDETNNSFSPVIIEQLGEIYNTLPEVRSNPIGTISTKLVYEDKTVDKDGVTYRPYNMSINPQVVINKTQDGYTEGQVVGIDEWRIKYTRGADGSIKMDVKMFDEQGIIASTAVIYREITDFMMSLSGSTLTFDNIARLIYSDESLAKSYASNYKYKISVGNNKLKEVNAEELIGTIVGLEIGEKEKDYDTLDKTIEKMKSLYDIAVANDSNRKYIQSPKLDSTTNILSYEYEVSSISSSSNGLSGNTRKETSSLNSYSRAETYEIRSNSSGEYYIYKTAIEKGQNANNNTVYYYAHDDKSSQEEYDGLLYNLDGKDYYNTYFYELIKSSSFENLKKYAQDGKITFKIELIDANDETVIIEKASTYSLSEIKRVFTEDVTNGQIMMLDFRFDQIPAYFNKGQNIIDHYGDIFTKSFKYVGNRTIAGADGNIDYDVTHSSDSDIMYDLTDANSAGYLELKSKLESLISNNVIRKTDVDELLRTAYFIKNVSSGGKFEIPGISSSVNLNPAVFDPYFLVINLNTDDVKTDEMIAIGIFDKLNSEGASDYAATRVYKLQYRVADSDEISIYRFNGRYTNGAGTEDNPMILYESEINNDGINIHFNGLTQIGIVETTGNTIVSLIATTDNAVANYEILNNEYDLNSRLGSFNLRYYSDNYTYYNDTTIYYTLVDSDGVQSSLQTVNEFDVAQTRKLYLYEGQNIGLTTIPAVANYNNNVFNINFGNFHSAVSGNQSNQSIITVTKNDGSIAKYYFVRGDNFADIGLDQLPGLTQVGDVTKITSSEKCSDYYYKFQKDGVEQRYYPYIKANYTVANQKDNVIINRLQYLIIIEKALNGKTTYEYDILETGASLIDNEYKNDPKTEINYFIDMGFKQGETGKVKFELYEFYYFTCNTSVIRPNQYYYYFDGSMQMPNNYCQMNHYYDEIDFEVRDAKLVKNNLSAAYINNFNITNLNVNNTDTPILFVKGEGISNNNRSYVTINTPFYSTTKTIYSYHNKNIAYLTYYLDDEKVDIGDPDIFKDRTSGILKIEVNYYGLILEYEFNYVVVDYLGLELDYVLNQKNTGQTFEFDLNSQLISSANDTYSSLHLYDKDSPNRSLRTLYMSNYNFKLSLYNAKDELLKIIPTNSEFKTFKELGCKLGETYKIALQYGTSELEAEFKFTLYDKTAETQYARLYHINGRIIDVISSNSSQPFYFLEEELLKLPFGYDDYLNSSDGFDAENYVANPSNSGYINNYYLSAYIYPTGYKTSQLIDLSKILGNFNSTTNTFDNVKFYIDGKEIEFVQEQYLHLQYDNATYNQLNYIYYYRVSAKSISELTKDGAGLLTITFVYNEIKYKTELPYVISEFAITYINGESSYCLLGKNNFNKNNAIVFSKDDNLMFGNSNYNDFINSYNRWDFKTCKNNLLWNKGYSYEVNDTNRPYLNSKYIDSSEYSATFMNYNVYCGTSGFGTAQGTYYSYSGFANYLYEVKIKCYDSSGSLLGTQLLYEKDKKSNYPKTFNFIADTAYGEITFTLCDNDKEGSSYSFKYCIREDLNDNSSGFGKFTKINNYLLENNITELKEYYLQNNENIYINSSATMFTLPHENGLLMKDISAPAIYTGSATGGDSGRIIAYYLAPYSTNLNYALNQGMLDAFSKNTEYNPYRNESQSAFADLNWKLVKPVEEGSRELDIWSVWNNIASDDVVLCVVYRHVDGIIYKIPVKLIKTEQVDSNVGIRRINDVYYYSDDVVIDFDNKNPILNLTTSSIWYKNSDISQSVYTISSLSGTSFSYSIDNKNTWIALDVVNGIVDLKTVCDKYNAGKEVYLKIGNIKINYVEYPAIIIQIKFSSFIGNIITLNEISVTDTKEITFYKGQKIATNSNSIYTTELNGKKSRIGFTSYIEGVTTNPKMFYYYSISNENLDKIFEDKETGELKYLYNNIEYNVKEVDGIKYYQIDNTDEWTVQENGTLLVEYRPTTNSGIVYQATCKIIVKEDVNNQVIYQLYYHNIKNNEDAKLIAINETANSQLVPYAFDYNSNKDLSITNTSNSYFRFSLANGLTKTIYFNNTTLTAKTYEISSSGEFINEQEFILGTTTLYNNEGFTQQDDGKYYTNIKVLVVSYQLNGITYSMNFYYQFSSYVEV